MKVFISDISKLSDESLPQAVDYLSQTERQRLDDMISVKRRREFVFGHFLLRRVLSQASDQPLDKIDIQTLPSGALVLGDENLGYVSLSHSNGQVAIAHCANPVGLDMEWIRAKDNYNEILEQIDSVKAAQELMSQGVSLKEAFFRLWTKREAYYKLSSVCDAVTRDSAFFDYYQLGDFMFCVASSSPQQIEWVQI